VPQTCPRCKNVRWNQKYTDAELALFTELGKQHIIPGSTMVLNSIHCNLDFIAQDFLFGIRPQPEMFELKQSLAIPIVDIERRHEYMLSVIRDRIVNRDRYEKEHFENYSSWFYVRLKTRDIIFGDYLPTLHRHQTAYRKDGCSHQDVTWIRDALWEEDGSPKGFWYFPFIKRKKKKRRE